MATTTDLVVGSAVTFLDGNKQTTKAGTIGTLSDNGRITINLTAGGSVTNVPHLSTNPYLGWYAVNTTTEVFTAVVQVTGTTKHRVTS